jgi:hypothetical protein
MGREKDSTVAIADSQSVKTTEKKGAVYGFDGGKKVQDRKRHLVQPGGNSPSGLKEAFFADKLKLIQSRKKVKDLSL